MTDTASPNPVDIFRLLADLGIAYATHLHVAVYTCDEAIRAVPDESGVAHTKNLFLRDKKGRRHWLLVTDCAKAVDLKALASVIGADHLSLGSPDRLRRHLGVEPGSVTALALANDATRSVDLVIDADVWSMERWRCHPLVNTATLVIARNDLERFFASTGHKPAVVQVPGRT